VRNFTGASIIIFRARIKTHAFLEESLTKVILNELDFIELIWLKLSLHSIILV